MGPPDNIKIAFGVAAAAAVVVVSYFLAKRLGIAGDGNRKQPQKKDELFASVVKEIKQQAQQKQSKTKHPKSPPQKKSKSAKPESPLPVPESQFPPEVPLEGKYLVDEQGYLPDSATEDSRRNRYADNGQNQTSFVVIDNGEGAVLPDNGQQAKKSDRSSDESSYDVIDEDRLAEAIEEGEGDEVEVKNERGKDKDEREVDDTVNEQRTEAESFMEVNETSMVVIEDSDGSGMSKSGSSFYVSADENGAEKESGSGGEKKKKDGEDDASVSEEDKTVLFTGNSKSLPVGADTEVLKGSGVGNTSANAVVGVASDEATQETEADLSEDEITEVLNTCQNSSANVSKEQIGQLVILLRKNIPELHSLVLNCLVRVTAFTQNITPLRENGCPAVIAAQVQESCKALTEGQSESETSLNSLCQVLTNLSMDPKTQEQLEDTVPALIDLLLLESASDSILLSILRPLVNFSSTTAFHGQYTRAIQQLYTLLDTGSHMTRIQCLKVLVNLSLNEDIVPNLLAAKAPVCLLDLLDQPTPDLILRAVTMLANIHKAVHDGTVTPDTLPVEAKAASPETMYMALNSVDRIATLRSKIFRLTRHQDEDISSQASRLYQYITEPSE